jgi:type IV pilus assembly protein PilC
MSNIKTLLSKEIELPFKNWDSQKYYFFQQMSILLDAKLDIKTAFRVLIKSTKKEAILIQYNQVLAELIGGKPLSDCLHKLNYFSTLDIHFIKIGEETGDLLFVFNHLKLFYQQRIKQRALIRTALGYPILVILITFSALLFMTNFVVPMFETLLIQTGGKLPAITQGVLMVSKIARTYWWFVILLFSILGILHLRYKNNLAYQDFIHLILIKVPYFGSLYKKVIILRFFIVLHLCIERKTTLTKALNLAIVSIKVPQYSNRLKLANEQVIKGVPLSIALENTSIFDERSLAFIKVGEEVNKLGSMCNTIINTTNDEIESQIKLLNQLIEPLLILFLGTIVGIILISMYLPLFELSRNFGV